MADLLSSSNQTREFEDPKIMRQNARNGMFLFVGYAIFYAGFVLINAFAPALMDLTPFGGINLAILYGGSLIVVAMILALIYSWLCRKRRPLVGVSK